LQIACIARNTMDNATKGKYFLIWVYICFTVIYLPAFLYFTALSDSILYIIDSM